VAGYKTCIDLLMYDGFIVRVMWDTLINKYKKGV